MNGTCSDSFWSEDHSTPPNTSVPSCFVACDCSTPTSSLSAKQWRKHEIGLQWDEACTGHRTPGRQADQRTVGMSGFQGPLKDQPGGGYTQLISGINQHISSWSKQKLGPLEFFRAKFWNCCVSSWCACTKMSQLLRCTLKRAAQRSGRADATVSKVCPIFCSHTGHWFSGESLLGIRNSCNSKDLSCCSRGFTSRTGRAGAEVSTVNVIWKNNLPIEVLKTQPQQPQQQQQQQQQQNIKYSALSFLFLSTTYRSALQSTTK